MSRNRLKLKLKLHSHHLVSFWEEMEYFRKIVKSTKKKNRGKTKKNPDFTKNIRTGGVLWLYFLITAEICVRTSVLLIKKPKLLITAECLSANCFGGKRSIDVLKRFRTVETEIPEFIFKIVLQHIRIYVREHISMNNFIYFN